MGYGILKRTPGWLCDSTTAVACDSTLLEEAIFDKAAAAIAALRSPADADAGDVSTLARVCVSGNLLSLFFRNAFFLHRGHVYGLFALFACGCIWVRLRY